MNKYLLDTHILLWSLLEEQNLDNKTIKLLNSPDNILYISPISIWEIIILAEKKRIKLDNEPETWVRNVLQTIPLHEAPLNHEVALCSRSIKLPHQDPADRFIAATATVYDLTLITSDKNLIKSAFNYKILPIA
ncbi:MAG: type II toxin-antitoxin system VapC family toxin [Spirochaetota bacterium]